MKDVAPRLISLNEVCARTGRSRWWLRDEWTAGRFPKPLRLGQRTSFVESEIDSWIRLKIEERDQGRAA
jgi:prophage regulatory protein